MFSRGGRGSLGLAFVPFPHLIPLGRSLPEVMFMSSVFSSAYVLFVWGLLASFMVHWCTFMMQCTNQAGVKVEWGVVAQAPGETTAYVTKTT